MRRRWREWALAAASFGIGLGLVAGCEALLRWVDPDHLARLSGSGLGRLHVYSETLGWTPRPGARLALDGKRLTINSHGYRGATAADAKDPGITRIVMLGDSITFGPDVGDDETFARRLDDTHLRWEVLNLAVMGYGTDQALLRLERDGLPLMPDVVVLNICLGNDFIDNMLTVFLYDGTHPKPYFRLEGGQLGPRQNHLRLGGAARLGVTLQEQSQVYNRVVATLARLGESKPPRRHAWRDLRNEALQQPQAARELTLALTARLRKRVEQAGARLIVLLHPDRRSYRGPSEWIDAFKTSSQLRGVPVVDLRTRYHAADERYWRLAKDNIGHLRPRGHRIAAQVIARVLQETGLAHHRATLPDPD